MTIRKASGLILSAFCVPALLCRVVPRAAAVYRQALFLPLTDLLRACRGVPAAVVLPAAAFAGRRGEGLDRAVRIICAALALYMLLWAPLYMAPAAQIKPVQNPESLAALCRTLIREANALLPLSDGSAAKETLAKEACRLMAEETGRSSLKAVFLPAPRVFSRIGLAGIYCPFTGMAMVNPDQSKAALPFTLCHELAHQAGFARESEANAAAFAACRRDDGIFRLSADYSMLLYAMDELYEADRVRWKGCMEEMSEALYRLFAGSNGLKTARPDAVRRVQQAVSDIFLKMNGEADGLASYGRAVDLIDLNGMLS